MMSATPSNPQEGDKKVESAYDYMSRRISKQVSVYEGGNWVIEKTITFVYDGWNVIREHTTTDLGNTTDYYVWGLDLSGALQGAGGIGGLLATTKNLTSNTYVYTFDANGNVGQLVDTVDGSIVAAYEYDPFGNLLRKDGTEAEHNPFRFSTKYFDAEVGWYYYGYRYYSPELGRWVNRDPIEERGSLNLYGFVRNNPNNNLDYAGLLAICNAIYSCREKCFVGWEEGLVEGWVDCYERLAPIAVFKGVEKALEKLGVVGVSPLEDSDLKALLPNGIRDFEKIKNSPGIVLEEVTTISDKKAWRIKLQEHDLLGLELFSLGFEVKIYLSYTDEYRIDVGTPTYSLRHYEDAFVFLAKNKGLSLDYPNADNAEAYLGYWITDGIAEEQLEKCRKCCLDWGGY